MTEALRVERLSKVFVVRRNPARDLKVRLLGFVHDRHREERSQLWALRDVDLSVGVGECFGVIGPNGSGKSTLLRIMAGIYAPSSGRVSVAGRVAPMIELGVGFHPDLTGRENLYLNTSLFGISRREADRQFDSIVAFSGIGDYLDMPVKNYSSGMYMRLGFAVAVHLEAQVFLVDEILAVGDEAFQRQCLERMHAIRAQGRSIVLVSHDLGLVERMCDRACLLHGGELLALGPPADVVAAYRRLATPA